MSCNFPHFLRIIQSQLLQSALEFYREIICWLLLWNLPLVPVQILIYIFSIYRSFFLLSLVFKLPDKPYIFIPNYRFSAFFGNVHQKVTWPRRRDNFRFVTVHSCCTYIISHPEQNYSGKNLARKFTLDKSPKMYILFFYEKSNSYQRIYIW